GNRADDGIRAVTVTGVQTCALPISITWLNSTYDGTTNAASAQADGVAGESNLSPASSLEYFNGSTAGVAGTGFTAAPKNAGTYEVGRGAGREGEEHAVGGGRLVTNV